MNKNAILKLNLHPISAHFPSALFPFSALLMILYLIRGEIAFEVGAKYSLWAGVCTNPIAIASGLIDWKLRYKAAKVPIFKKKITYSITAQLIAMVCTAWYVVQPEVLTVDNVFPYIFTALMVTCTVFTFLVGRWGARLVYL